MNRPRVIINCAMSIDGKIALPSRKPLKISNKEDMKRVHTLRHQCDAILVGIGTVLMDDPKLLVNKKYVQDGHHPLRIVLDSSYRIPENARVLSPDSETLIVTTCKEEKRNNIEVIKCGQPGRKVNLKRLMELLYTRGIRTLMVEGGETVIWEFLRLGLCDELTVFIAPFVVGGVSSPTLAGGNGIRSSKNITRLKFDKIIPLGDGIILRLLPLETPKT